MSNDELIHNWLVTYLGSRLSRDYDEVKTNLAGEKKNEFEGHYPDLILGNHGLVVAVMEVETEKSITAEKADEWFEIVSTARGVKLIIMSPKASKAKVIDLLWKKGIADKASVGSYELNVQMP